MMILPCAYPHTVRLDLLIEHGDTFSLPHDLHSLDLRDLEGLHVPMDTSGLQGVDQPRKRWSMMTSWHEDTSQLLAICEGNPWMPNPTTSPITHTQTYRHTQTHTDPHLCFSEVSLNELWNKQSNSRWLRGRDRMDIEAWIKWPLHFRRHSQIWIRIEWFNKHQHFQTFIYLKSNRLCCLLVPI